MNRDFDGDKLPDKPSAFIRYAVQSVVDLEDNGRFIIDLSVWESQDELGTCRICLGGAAALKAGVEFFRYTDGLTGNEYQDRKYHALAFFADGRYHAGLCELGMKRSIAYPYSENPYYSPDVDYEAWKQGLLGFAAHLESKGY